MKKLSKAKFDVEYFLRGPYKKSVREGLGKYFNQFWWARRYYALLIKRYKAQGNLLEIGCGFGDQLNFLEDSFNCLGVDISASAIEKARIETRSKFRVLKAEDILKLNKKYDVVIANHLLEHVKDPDKILKKIHQILAKAGIFLMATPNTGSLMRDFRKQNWIGHQDKTHISLHSDKQWEAMLIKNNFQIIKKVGDGFWAVPYIGFLPSTLQLVIFDFLGIIQTIFVLTFLPSKLGESVIFLVKKV